MKENFEFISGSEFQYVAINDGELMVFVRDGKDNRIAAFKEDDDRVVITPTGVRDMAVRVRSDVWHRATDSAKLQYLKYCQECVKAKRDYDKTLFLTRSSLQVVDWQDPAMLSELRTSLANYVSENIRFILSPVTTGALGHLMGTVCHMGDEYTFDIDRNLRSGEPHVDVKVKINNNWSATIHLRACTETVKAFTDRVVAVVNMLVEHERTIADMVAKQAKLLRDIQEFADK